jgi:hypothetical protein
VLLTLNKKYKSAGAGIRFTNLVVPGQPAAPNPKGT